MMLVKVVSVPPNSDKITKRAHDICFICGNRGINQSYHRIPTHSPIREKWLQALRIKEPANSSIRICSIHFQKEDFRKLGENCRKILHRNAVPSKLLKIRFDESKLIQTMRRSHKSHKKCCICGNSDRGFTYHTFPVKPNLRKKWAEACGLKDHQLLKTKLVCQKHFQPEDYFSPVNSDRNRRKLKKGVIPSLLLWGPSGERRNSIINIPPPYRPLIPNRFTNVVIKNLNDIDNVTIPPTFTSLTPVSVNPAVISSLCVVLGEQNTNLKPNNSKTTQVNSSSAMATSKDNEKSSESSAKATRDKPPLVVELSGSETDTDFEVDKYDKMPAESNSSVPAQSNSSATTETHSSTPTNANSSALTKNNSSTPTPMETNSSMPSKTNSKINEDQSVLSQDDENSNYSVDEFIVEEEQLSSDENEASSNSGKNSQPATKKISAPAIRPQGTKYRPILPAPANTLANARLIEAITLKQGLRSDHAYEKNPAIRGPPLLWRYPSDIGSAHCNTPSNAWRAVQMLKSTIEKQKGELKALQQFKRRTLIKMHKMNEELQDLKKKQKADDADEVEPWWV